MKRQQQQAGVGTGREDGYGDLERAIDEWVEFIKDQTEAKAAEKLSMEAKEAEKLRYRAQRADWALRMAEKGSSNTQKRRSVSHGPERSVRTENNSGDEVEEAAPSETLPVDVSRLTKAKRRHLREDEEFEMQKESFELQKESFGIFKGIGSSLRTFAERIPQTPAEGSASVDARLNRIEQLVADNGEGTARSDARLDRMEQLLENLVARAT